MPLSYDARSVFSLFSMKYMGSCPLNRKNKTLRSPGIDSKDLIPPAYGAWRAGTTTPILTRFLALIDCPFSFRYCVTQRGAIFFIYKFAFLHACTVVHFTVHGYPLAQLQDMTISLCYRLK